MARRLLLTFGLLTAAAIAPAPAPAGAQTADSAAQQVIAFEKAYLDAQLKKDRPRLERMLADDFLYTHSNGSVFNKAQELAETVSSGMTWRGARFEDLNVRLFGDVAVVTGRQIFEGTAKGYATGPRRMTDIFARRNGQWQFVGGQSALEPSKRQ
jgi:ketosteroid isomerase-like protein